MKDIKTIPEKELEKDLYDSLVDAGVCRMAIKQGIIEYSGGPVEKRLKANEHFVEVIAKELRNRKGKVSNDLRGN